MPVDPSTISGLVGWWKADAISGLSDTDPVSTWPDSSGQGNDATASSGAEPTYRTNQINGLPAVRFNLDTGTSSEFMSTALSVNTPFTLFLVFQRTDANETFFARALAGTGDEWLGTESDFRFAFWPAVGGAYTEDVWYAISGIRRASPSPETRLWQAFTQLDTDADTGNFGTVHLGGPSGAGADSLRGFIAEALVYDEALSDSDHEAVTEYLQDKYALTPSSPPRTGRIHQVYLDLPTTERTGRIHQVYLSLPSEARTGRIYQAYLSTPDFQQTGKVYQAWLTIPSPASGTGGPGGGLDGEEEIVADFVRTLSAIHATDFENPRGKSSWAHTGKGQFRAGYSAGRTWTETYVPRRKSDAEFHGWMAYLRELQQNERTFEISVPDIQSRPVLLGTATGTILVNGANQTGFSIAADGGSGTLAQGDLIRIDGLTYTMEVQATVAIPGTISINPGILAGGSPDNDAEIFYGSAVKIRAKIDNLLPAEVDGEQIYTGLRIRFREVP